MIDISVTDLVKSFDLEKKILDGVKWNCIPSSSTVSNPAQ